MKNIKILDICVVIIAISLVVIAACLCRLSSNQSEMIKVQKLMTVVVAMKANTHLNSEYTNLVWGRKYSHEDALEHLYYR